MIFFSFHRIKFGTSDDPVIIKTTANNNMLESKKQDTKMDKAHFRSDTDRLWIQIETLQWALAQICRLMQ